MLEAILKAFRSPSDAELAAAKLESMRARIINVAKYKSNHTAFILDHYLLKEFTMLAATAMNFTRFYCRFTSRLTKININLLKSSRKYLKGFILTWS